MTHRHHIPPTSFANSHDLGRMASILVVVLAGFRFIGLGFGELQPWDEGLYALRSLAATRFGAWWDQAPWMPGGPYYCGHPPLQVWLSSLITLLTGPHLWAFRIVPAAAGAALVILFWIFSRRWSGDRAVRMLLTAFVAVNPLLLWHSRQGQLDSLLSLLMLASLELGRRSLEEPSWRGTITAGVLLGLALLTKFLFAFSIPAALFIAAFMAPRRTWPRRIIVSVTMVLVSLPVWLPWFLSFTAAHGQGDPFFLLSEAMPFGATLAGREGTLHSIGAAFYPNQLVVHLSFLLPVAVWGCIRPLRGDTRLRPFVVFLVVQLAALGVMASRFTAYLVPVIPVAIALTAAPLEALPSLPRPRQPILLVLMLALAVWGMSPGLRVAVKSLTAGPPAAPVIIAALAFAAAVTVGAALMRWLTARTFWRTMLTAAVAALAVQSMVQIWIIDPDVCTPGAGATATFARSMHVPTVVIIGNRDNPQMSWYLDGADLGWPQGTATQWVRMEPRLIPTVSLRDSLTRRAAPGGLGIILERDDTDDIRASMLPDNARLLLEQRGYSTWIVSPSAVPPHGAGGS